MPAADTPGRTSAAAYGYLLTTTVLFGSAMASSKAVVGHVPPQVGAALRFGAGAVVLLLLLAALRGRSAPLTRGQALRAGLVGLLGVFAYNIFFFWGLSLAPSIDGSVIVPVLSPVITVAALLAMRRESASAARIAGLALGVAGAVVFFLGIGGGGPLSGSRLLGDLGLLLAAASWAAYSIVSKNMLSGMDPLRATTWATAVGALALVVLALPQAPEVDWAALPASMWGNVLYLAVGPTAVAYLFYYRALREVSASTATIIMLSMPVVGIACSMAFLGESFTAVQIAGSVVMLVGSALAVFQRRSGSVRQAPPPAVRTAARRKDGAGS